MPAFGHLSAWSITADQMAAGHQAMINSGYSVASANRDLSAIGTIYRWAINGAKCSPAGFASPTVGVRRARESERIVEVDDEVIDQLRARSLAFKDRRFGLFVALLCDTGARKSEILERRWSDFLLDQRQIVVQLTKNGKPKILYFSEETLSLLKRVAPTRQPERLVFEGRIVGADLKLTPRGCGGKVGLIYVVSPRLSLYSEGLSDPREILIRFSLYQWIYESTI